MLPSKVDQEFVLIGVAAIECLCNRAVKLMDLGVRTYGRCQRSSL